jgi:cell division protein FtsA
VTDIIPNIIASTEIAIDYDHRDLGTVLIDIGKNQSSYVIYEDGYPLGYGVIPIGGEDVTKDISIGMQIDIKEAEDLKRSYGTALLSRDNMPENSPVDMLFLSDIINARYEEIFNKVNNHLIQLEKDGKLPGGVLLIG